MIDIKLEFCREAILRQSNELLRQEAEIEKYKAFVRATQRTRKHFRRSGYWDLSQFQEAFKEQDEARAALGDV